MVFLLLSLLAGCGTPTPPPVAHDGSSSDDRPFLVRRAEFETRLEREAPTVPEWPELTVPEGAELVTYPSNGIELQGLFVPRPGDGPAPLIVYFHNGFYLDPAELGTVREAFAGLAVGFFAPTLRGRNGNPGHHELLLGEVDDAHAALRWAAARTDVDAEAIYVVGHSLGGATVAMLTLYPDVPMQLSASIGGIYAERTFPFWASRGGVDRNLVRFDLSDRNEVELRILGPHAEQMVHDHIAFFGTEETWGRRNASAVEARAPDGRFEVRVLPGDHMSVLAPALHVFREQIGEALPPVTEPPSSTALGLSATSSSVTSSNPSSRFYDACGCGCCGGTDPVEVSPCVNAAELERIAAADRQASQDPQCAAAGCSIGHRYVACDP
ncbi:MAG: alpha/beta fold hydrolase [Myxococcota bacterium]